MRIRGWLKTMLELAALALLAVSLVLVFRGVAARQDVQVAQSPIQSPAPPRESTPTVVHTPTPTRETLFESPLPTPTPSPTPTSPVTVVPGPLPPGLKIVCVDKGEDDWTSVIWIANVDDLNHVQVIAKLQNLTRGEGPFGHISPDGRQIAYILPRKHYSESVLGVVNIDGTENRVLDDPVDGPGVEWLLRWSPDSRWIAYLHRVPPRPDSENSEIWLIHPDGTGKKLLVSGLRAVLLIGWSKDSSQLYYHVGSDLLAVNIDGETPPSVLLHLDSGASHLRLSPDGKKINYLTRKPRPAAPDTVMVMSIDGLDKHVLVEGIDSRGFAFENYTLSPIWSPDSTRVVYNLPVDSTHTEILSIPWDASEATTVIRNKEQVYYKPISWSPDGRFIAAWRYPLDAGPDAKIHLVLVGLDGSLRRVYSIEPDFPLPTFVGWLDGKT